MLLPLLCLWFIFYPQTQATGAAAGHLTLWVHPYLPATELVNRFTPLAEYLAAGLDRPVEIRVPQNYQTHVEVVGRNQADLAFMGPAGYVAMRRQYGEKPLLAVLEEKGSILFHGVIIVRQDSLLHELGQVKGQSFAFGDPHSTMSYLVPRAMLARAGVELADLARYDFLNSHHDVALGVLGGYFAAGGVKDEVFDYYQPRGLRALAVSPPIPDHLFATRSNLDTGTVERLRELLLAVNEHPDRQLILGSIKDGLTGLRPVTAEDYDELAALTEEFDDD